VLHYLEDPPRALKEAARILSPGGRLVVVDFAPHDDETLRNEHAHRRLGFSHAEVSDLVRRAGLEMILHRDLASDAREGAKLTVSLWVARDPRVIADVVPSKAVEAA
jgi:SAM-dependent methyltransferase